MVELENRGTDFDNIWYGRHVMGACPKNSTFAFFTLGNTNMADEQTYDVGSTLAPLAMK
jgi:hypothetical protein